MGRTSKAFALFLTLIIALSCLNLLTVKPSNAQNPSPTPLPVPLTPDFTVKITNTSYFVPVTYSTDPYTGQKIANQSYYSGYVDALNITITIKNQPLALSVKSDDYSGFKYFLELKPHNSANWTSITYYIDGLGQYQTGSGFIPSNGSCTTLTFQFSNPYFPVNDRKDYPANSSGLTYATNPIFPMTISKNELVDLRVRAGIGNFQYMSMGQLWFNGEYSDWNQLSIKMAKGETSTEIFPSPSIPEVSLLIILPLLLSVFAVAVVLKHQKST